MTRTEELRNDIDNLHFSRRYYIGVLAELEQLGKTQTKQFKWAESQLKSINHNIKRLEEELEDAELEEIDPSYFSFSSW